MVLAYLKRIAFQPSTWAGVGVLLTSASQLEGAARWGAIGSGLYAIFKS